MQSKILDHPSSVRHLPGAVVGPYSYADSVSLTALAVVGIS